VKIGKTKRGSKIGRWLAPPPLGTLELDMLVLLADEERELTGSDFSKAGVAQGSIYTTLQRLERKDLVLRLDPGKRYVITRLGHRLVWLCQDWYGMQRLSGRRKPVAWAYVRRERMKA